MHREVLGAAGRAEAAGRVNSGFAGPRGEDCGGLVLCAPPAPPAGNLPHGAAI